MLCVNKATHQLMKAFYVAAAPTGTFEDSPVTRAVVRLWLHECTRVFYDRLVDDNDQKYFEKILMYNFYKFFCLGN